jgi:perosamine synthetase
LHGAVFAAELEPGDEGMVPPLTFCATANCLLYQGATPVFADVDSETLTLDPHDMARRLTRRTRAVLPVDYAGHPAALPAILELADRYGLVVIEDACHALGATMDGHRIGSLSHMTVFSFHPVKHITTGEGGMVTTNDAGFAKRLRLFRQHGIDSDPVARETAGEWYYEMLALGYNYRLADIGCALGLSQLKRLDANLARRRAIAQRYLNALAELPAIILPTVRADVHPAWHLFPIRLKLEALQVGRAEVFCALRAENIGVNVHHIPVHLHPYYRKRFGYRAGDYAIAEAAYEQLISLPMFHGMSDQDADEVVDAVRKVVGYYAL